MAGPVSRGRNSQPVGGTIRHRLPAYDGTFRI
jgi:hypothetical protein